MNDVIIEQAKEIKKEKIKKQTFELVNQMYRLGFIDGVEKTKNEYEYEITNDGCYKRGLDEAWECTRNIVDLWLNKMHCDRDRFNRYFNLNAKLGESVLDLFFKQYSVTDAIKKMKEEDQKHDKHSCFSCKNKDKSGNEWPCKNCSHNQPDFWEHC